MFYIYEPNNITCQKNSNFNPTPGIEQVPWPNKNVGPLDKFACGANSIFQ